MFFLALKLIKLFVRGIVWLVKLPIKITMKLAGAAGSDDSGSAGSRTNTKTRTTTETANAGATPSQSTGTATADRQQAAAAASGAATATGGAAATVSADSLSKYQRFRQSLLAFAVLSVLSPLWLIVSADLLAFGVGGEFLIGMVIGSAIPAGLWYWTRQRSKVAWGVAMAYTVLQLLLSLVGTSALAVAVPGGSAFGQRPILALLQLASLAALAAVLYFGATGRDAVGQPVAVAPETTETAGGAGASAPAGKAPSSPTDTTTQQSSSVSESTTSGGTVSQSDESATASTASSAEDAPAAAAAASATGDDAAETSAGGATERSESAAATADTNTTTEETATAATEDGGTEDSDAATDEASDEIEPLLDDLWTEPADPETVRELGETLSTADPSEEVVNTLERCSRADDPEVRVAVCDVCADLDGSEPESILQRLRIDTNDRVATTAMDAL